MKKSYIFLSLIFVSSLTFAQSKIKQATVTNLSSINVSKEIDNTTHSLTAKAIVDSLNYDGADISNAVGTNGAATFEAMAFFSAAQLAGHNANGNTITSIKLYINGVADVASTQLKFYSNQTTVVYSQAFTPIEGWNDVVLTTPFVIPATDLYVGYECVATGGYPLGCDAGPTNPNGDWTVYSGTWYHLPALGAALTYNWHIRAMVDGTPLTTPVASCTPLAWNAGAVELTQTATSGTFTLTNNAAGTLTASSITGLSAPFTSTFVPASVSLGAGQSTTFTFSYNPTVVGTVNQTAVIATNGGNITITLTGKGIVCNTISTYPFSEGFEGTTFAPDCWSMNDVDGDGYNWRAGTGVSAHSGTKTAVSESYLNSTGALTPDNYLITPQFNINASNLQLTYWVAAQDFNFPGEKYSVMISTTGKAPANFTAAFTETLTDTTWGWRSVDLSTYNGQNIYIAFRHFNSTDVFNFKIDDVLIDISTGIASNDLAKLDIYPNPSTGVFTVKAIDNNSTVEVYNIVGERMLSSKLVNGNNTIDMSNMSVGTYFFKVTSNGEVTTRKVVLSK